MTTYDELRKVCADQDTGQLPNLMPIVARLEIEWGRREVWEDEPGKVLRPDAAAEIEWQHWRGQRSAVWPPK